METCLGLIQVLAYNHPAGDQIRELSIRTNMSTTGGHTYSNISATDQSRQHNGDIYQYGKDRKDKILKALKFHGMDSWKHRPLEAMEGTFQWILHDLPRGPLILPRSTGIPRNSCITTEDLVTNQRLQEAAEANKLQTWLRSTEAGIF